MKHLFITTGIAVALVATTALAQDVAPVQGQATNPLVESIVAQYRSEGFTRLEVDTGPRQIKVEATRDGRELEVVYDAATGAIIYQAWDNERERGDDRPGVYYDRDDDDWVDAQGNYIDDRDDDHDDDDRRDDHWDDDDRDDDRWDDRDDDRDDRWDDDDRDDDDDDDDDRDDD